MKICKVNPAIGYVEFKISTELNHSTVFSPKKRHYYHRIQTLSFYMQRNEKVCSWNDLKICGFLSTQIEIWIY